MIEKLCLSRVFVRFLCETFAERGLLLKSAADIHNKYRRISIVSLAKPFFSGYRETYAALAPKTSPLVDVVVKYRTSANATVSAQIVPSLAALLLNLSKPTIAPINRPAARTIPIIETKFSTLFSE